MTKGFDVIGDIHGHLEPLQQLLDTLGYRIRGGAYEHPQGRKVVFLGDFIDRGPAIRESLHLVKGMIDRDSAVAVMGNHEYNAVSFHTPDGNGDYLRSHTFEDGKNVEQHQATLEAFRGLDGEWNEWIAWFKTLPFFLDLGDLRAVHATWDVRSIAYLAQHSLTDPVFLKQSAIPGTEEFLTIEQVLKGIEVQLPEGHYFIDKQGHHRPRIRVRWWEESKGKSYRQAVFPDCETVPDIPLGSHESSTWSGYAPKDPPVFFGHYWLPSLLAPAPLAPNVACLDFSVAKPGGKLVAYRWSGEASLHSSNFVEVSRPPISNMTTPS